jgi:hypothetical protein
MPSPSTEPAWVCNECGGRAYRASISEDDVARLACDGCGGWDFHKEPIDFAEHRASPLEEQANEISMASVGLVEMLRLYEVTDDEEYSEAAEQLRSIKGMQSDLLQLRLSLTRPLDESKKRIMTLFREPTERLEEAERLLKAAIGTYYSLSTDEGPDGGLEAPETPYARGISHRETWSAVVYDFEALIAAVASGFISQQALLANRTWLNNVARGMRQDLAMPGVRGVKTSSVAAERTDP